MLVCLISILFVCDPRGDIVYRRGDLGLGLDVLYYLVAGVHDGGVMLAAEEIAYRGVGAVGQRAAEVHRHLAGEGYAPLATSGHKIVHGQSEVVDDHLRDEIERDGAVGIAREIILQNALGKGQGDGFFREIRLRQLRYSVTLEYLRSSLQLLLERCI